MRTQWINGGMCLTSNEEMIRSESGARFDEAARLWLRITCELQTCSVLVILFAPWTNIDSTTILRHVSPHLLHSCSFWHFWRGSTKIGGREGGGLFLFSFFLTNIQKGKERRKGKYVARSSVPINFHYKSSLAAGRINELTWKYCGKGCSFR